MSRLLPGRLPGESTDPSIEARPHQRVLLVEDDPGDAYLVRELLAEVDATVELTVVDSVAGALAPGALDRADCVLLDLNLPGSVGLAGLAALLAAAPHAAVCVLTGLADEHLGTAAVAAGAQDYLVKGTVDGAVLIRAIRYAVERRRAETSQLRLREARLVAAESARLERGLLPSPLLAGTGVRAVSRYRSGRTRAVIGGDFFDAVGGPDGTVHAIVGDVCGHGPDEAALGALLRVSWRALVLAGVPEPGVLPKLQELLVSERPDPTLFTTVATVVVTPTAAGATALARVAGHPPPVLLGHGGPVSARAEVGLPLGIRPDAGWPPVELALPPEWALLLYTDGLIEGRGPRPPDRLWEEGLLELLVVEAATALDDLPDRLVRHVEGLNGGPLADDLAILLLTRGPG